MNTPQQSRFLALVGNYDRLSELYDEAANSQDAATLQTLKTMDSIETKINQLKTTFQEFYTSTGIEDFIKLVLDGITEVINYLNGLPKVFGKLPVQAISVGASLITGIKVILNQIVTAVSNTWEEVKRRSKKDAEDAGKGAAKAYSNGVKGVIEKLKSNDLEAKNRTISNLLSMAGGLMTTGGIALGASAEKDGDPAAWLGSLLTGAGTAATYGSIGTEIGMLIGHPLAGRIIGIVTGAIASLPAVFDSLVEDLEERAERLEKEAEKATQDSILAQDEYTTLNKQIKEWEKLREARYDSSEAMESYNEANNTLIESYPELLSFYTAEGEAVIDTIALYDELRAAKAETARTGLEAANANYNSALAAYDAAYGGMNTKNLKYDPLKNAKFTEQNIFDTLGDNGFGDGKSATQGKDDPVESWLHNNFRGLFDETGNLIENYQDSEHTIQDVIDKVRTSVSLGEYQDILLSQLLSLQDNITNEATQWYNNDLSTITSEMYGAFGIVDPGNYDPEQLSEGAKKGVDIINRLQVALGNFVESGDLTELESVMTEISSEDNETYETLSNWWKTRGSKLGFSQYQNLIYDSLFGEEVFDWSTVIEAVKNAPERKQLAKGANIAAQDVISNYVKAGEETSNLLFGEESPFSKVIGNIFEEAVLEGETSSLNPNLLTEDAFKSGGSAANAIQSIMNSIEQDMSKLNSTEQEAVLQIQENFNNGAITLAEYWDALAKYGIDLVQAIEDSELYKGNEDGASFTESDAKIAMAEETGLATLESNIEALYGQISGWFKKDESLGDWVPHREIDDLALTTSQIMLNFMEANLAAIESSYGKTVQGNALASLIIGFRDKVESLTDENQIQAEAILQNADLFSLEGILSTVEQLKEIGLTEDSNDGIIKNLLFLKDYININLNTEIESYASKTQDQLKDFSDAISKATSGMDIEEAIAAANKAGYSVADFTKVGDKYFLANQAQREAYIKAYYKPYEELQQAIQDEINKLPEGDAERQEYQELLNNVTKTAEDATKYQIDLLSIASFDLEQVSGLEKVNHSAIWTEARKGEDALRTYLSSLGVTIEESYFQAIMDAVGSSADSLISAFTSAETGQNIDLVTLANAAGDTNLAALVATLGTNGNVVNSKESFKQLLELLNYSTEAYNDAMVSYVEATTKDYQSALEGILSDPTNVDYSAIAELGNVLGKTAEELISAYFQSDGFGNYEITDDNLRALYAEQLAGQIEYGDQLLVDHFQETLDEILGMISSGISGDLTNVEFAKLEEYMKGFDEDINLETMQTGEGLKLTQNSLAQVYSTLKETEPLAASIVLEELANSAEDADESLGNIYNVLEKIEDLTEQINTEGISDNRRKALEAELDVATEIRDRLMEAGDAFNFMEQDLPTGVTNPLSAWEGAGAAMDVLNGESFAKDGYMGVQDFTNMINFIGDDILSNAEIFGDKTTTASDLIRAGYEAIKIIDGEAVVDWSGLATQFQLSGDELAEGVTEGIHTLAETQIDIIDAEIAVLETVVKTQEAFDSIDLDDSNKIELDEFMPQLIPGTEDQYHWADKQYEALSQMTSTLGEDFSILVNELGDSIKLGALSDPNFFMNLSSQTQQMIMGFINNYWQSIQNINWSDLGNGENINAVVDLIQQQLAFEGKGIKEVDTSALFDGIIFSSAEPEAIRQKLEATLGLADGTLANLDISQDILTAISNGTEVTPAQILSAAFNSGKLTADDYMSYIRQMLIGDGNDNTVELGFSIQLTEQGEPTIVTEEGTPVNADALQKTVDSLYDGENIEVVTDVIINGKVTSVGYKGESGEIYSTPTECIEKEAEIAEAAEIQQKVDIIGQGVSEGVISALETISQVDFTTANSGAKEFLATVGSISEAAISAAEAFQKLTGNTETGGKGETGLTIKIPEIDENTITLLNSFNSAIAAAKENGTPESGITVTITGISTESIDSINNYNKAVDAIPEEASSSVSSSVTISVSDLLKIAQLKAAVEALKSSPNIDTTIAAQAEGTALAVVSDMLALYGYNGKTAELIFNATDPQETLTTVKEQIDGIQSADDNPIQFQVDLLKGDIEAQLANLTKTEEKLIKITYEEPESVGEYKSGEGNYRFKGIDNSSGNLMTYSGYSSLQSAIDAIKSFVYNNQLNEGQYTIEKIESDNLVTESTAVTVTAGTVDLSGEISFPTATVGETSTSSNIVTGNNLVFNEPIVPVIDTASMIASVEDAASAMASLIESGGLLGGALAAKKIQSSLDNIKDPSIKVKYPSSVTVKVKIDVETKTSSSSNTKVDTSTSVVQKPGTSKPNSSGPQTVPKAKGDVALARGTLMGELGPELVVSNGQYYIVGQNGAEFIDLADDAIVFNHLQTKKLLGNGSISGTGSPVTNEKKAVSYATGNANGPAMASASDALAALYELRAMWSALLGASAKDLGQKAANSGGGGGGGNSEDNSSYLHDLDRWYNLLRQIAKWEQKITYEQARRQNLQSGYDYHESLQKELDMLKKQQEAYSELAKLQRDYYDQRRDDLQDTIYSQIFTYDEDGLMQYTSSGFDILESLNSKDEDGETKSAKNQFKELYQALGLTAKELKNILRKNEDGTELESDDYKGMMENFWSGIDGWMDELDGLYDEVNDHLTAIEENQTAQEEILREYTEARLSVEEKLLTAMTDMAQNNIDALQDNLDALTEASENYIDGLSNALEQERNMYQQNEYDKETQKLQRQLAILQRSGGSASEIKALQEQLDSRMQEDYFKQQQEQIDRLQEAADIQNEKLQKQIDIATETLEYQKENGLFWPQIMEMMATWTPEALLAFIRENTNSYKEDSPTQNEEKEDETKKEFELLDAQKENEAMNNAWDAYLSGTTYSDEIKEKYGDEAYKAYTDAYKAAGGSKAEGSIAAAAAAANAVFNKGLETPEIPPVEEEEIEEPKTGTVTVKKGSWNIRSGPGTSYKDIGTVEGGKELEWLGETADNGWFKVKYKNKEGWISNKGATLKMDEPVKKYKTGGLVDYTGPAWVDGSKSKPEAFLSADDTAMLKSKIFSDSDYSLRSVVESIQGLFSSLGTINNSTVSDNGIVFENVTVEIQSGVISSDYDARRAGELALEEMMKIARRSTNIGVSRR